MKTKRLRLTALALGAALLCSSCDLFNTNAKTLMQPPAPTGEYAEIVAALNKEFTQGFQPIYPTTGTGDNLSSYVLTDLFHDGAADSALAFFKTNTDAVRGTMALLHKENGKWRLVKSVLENGSGLQSVNLQALDSSGDLSVITSWSLPSGTGMELVVDKPTLSSIDTRLRVPYMTYAVEDMDGDGERELVTIAQTAVNAPGSAKNATPTPAQQTVARAAMYKFTADNLLPVIPVAPIPVDASATAYEPPQTGPVNKDIPVALYFDGDVGQYSMLTELIYYQKATGGKPAQLVDPFYNEQQNANTVTLRSARVPCQDIDNFEDPLKRICIPQLSPLPGYENDPEDRQLNLITWQAFDGKALQQVFSTFFDNVLSYFLIFPAAWITKPLSVTVRPTNAGSMQRDYCLRDENDGTPGPVVLSIRALSKTAWDKRTQDPTLTGYQQIHFGGDVSAAFIYAAKLGEAGEPYNIDFVSLQSKYFHIIS